MCLSELFSLLNDAPLPAEFFLIECDLLSETELSANPELFTAQDEAPENQTGFEQVQLPLCPNRMNE